MKNFNNQLTSLKKYVGTLLITFLTISLATSCYAPLSSSSKQSAHVRSKLHTVNLRKHNAKAWQMQDLSVDCPSSSRRKQRY